VKLLLAGAVLLVAMWKPAPAEAWCHIQPFLADNEAACERTCYEEGCFYYYFIDPNGCFCS
jgi:hypothetical protein